MEHHRGDRYVVAHGRHDLAHAHAPGTVACITQRRTLGCRGLRADHGGQCIAAVAKTHGRKEAARALEAQVTVRHRVDVADVGGHHHIRRHGLFQLAQDLARVQPVATGGRLLTLGFLDHVQAVGVALVRPAVKLLFPGSLLGLDVRRALGTCGVTGQCAAGQARREGGGGGLGVATDADIDLLHQAQHLVIGIDLDDLGVFGPVVHAVLRQGAERTQARAERYHHVGFADELHARLAALVTERAAPLRVAGRKGVVVLVAVDHRAAQPLGQRNALGPGLAHHHAATGDQDRVPGCGQQFSSRVQAGLTAGAAVQSHGARNLYGNLAVEQVARNVQLCRAKLRMGTIKTARGVFGHAFVVVHVPLVLGELLEHGQLIGFLEAAQTLAHGAGLRRNQHNRAVRPVGSGNGGDAIADARAVLSDHHAVAAAGARVAVGHVARALLVHHRDEPDAGRCKDVHRIHEGRSHDAEHVGHVVGHQSLNEGFRGSHLLHSAHDRTLDNGGFAHGAQSPGSQPPAA